MISFKQFLLEQNQDIFDLIKKDCQPFLKAADGKFLIRGSFRSTKGSSTYKDPNNESMVFRYDKLKVRKDRKSLHTEQRIVDIENKWFKEKFGVNARSETLFCYKEERSHQASIYGHNLYSIFPIGEFKIIWSPELYDLYTDIGRNMTEENIREVLDNGQYTDKDIPGAFETISELMVVCDEYYALPYYSKDNNLNYITKYIKEKLS